MGHALLTPAALFVVFPLAVRVRTAALRRNGPGSTYNIASIVAAVGFGILCVWINKQQAQQQLPDQENDAGMT